MSNAFNAAFQRLDQRARPLPVGSRLQMARYNTFNAACSVGKWPRALTCGARLLSYVRRPGSLSVAAPVRIAPIERVQLTRRWDLNVFSWPRLPIQGARKG